MSHWSSADLTYHWFGLVYWGLTPQQQPGSYGGGEMMMIEPTIKSHTVNPFIYCNSLVVVRVAVLHKVTTTLAKVFPFSNIFLEFF